VQGSTEGVFLFDCQYMIRACLQESRENWQVPDSSGETVGITRLTNSYLSVFGH
jgi:hypothetical protein